VAQRYDVSTLKPAKTMPDGRLVVDATLTRTGVFTYRDPNGGERKEYRSHEEVSRADSLETLAMAPVSNDHPSEPVNAKNARKYAVGSVGEGVRMDGNHVVGRLVVHDEPTIAAMKAGKRQVSCGYECDIVEGAGVAPNGERYDARQTNIVYNHVAIVDKGRAGTAAVRMDAAVMRVDGDLDAAQRSDLPPREFAAPPDKLPIENAAHVRDAMSRFGQTHFQDAAEKKAAFHKIVAKAHSLGIDAENFIKEWSGRLDHAEPGKDRIMNLEQALAALAAANEKLGAANTRADNAERALASEKERATRLEGERDAQKSRADAAEKARQDAVDGAPARVKARVDLETKATRVIGPKLKRADGAEVELPTASEREIKLAVIKHVENVDCDVDGAGQKRPDIYIDARYDAAVERAGKSEQVFQGAMRAIHENRADATGADLGEDAKKKHLERGKTLFIQPGASAAK
jgi:hypothetical protein